MLWRDDDGKPLGMIMRFYEDAPTYAWVGISAFERDATRSGARYFNARRLGAYARRLGA